MCEGLGGGGLKALLAIGGGEGGGLGGVRIGGGRDGGDAASLGLGEALNQSQVSIQVT